MWYAKKEDEEGNVLCLWTYDENPPQFTEEDIGCKEITEEEYNTIIEKLRTQSIEDTSEIVGEEPEIEENEEDFITEEE